MPSASTTSPAERLDALADRLEVRLRAPLPGLDAQLRMAPVPRPGSKTWRDVPACPEAAVLLLLYPVERRPHVLFTRRTDRVLHHPGQISFPGGARDDGEDLRETALREAREEAGVSPDRLRILGGLTPLFIPPSGFCVFPFVGLVPERPSFRPEPEEVAELIEVPLDHLLDPATARREEWLVNGAALSVPFYEFGAHKIWGATAMMLAEFLAVLAPES